MASTRKEWHLEDPEKEYLLENGFLHNLDKICIWKTQKVIIDVIQEDILFTYKELQYKQMLMKRKLQYGEEEKYNLKYIE